MQSNTIKIAISTCPNDIFIFGGVISNHSFGEINVDITLSSISDLNLRALENDFDVIKISAALYPKISSYYDLLPIGASFGRNEGPKLVASSRCCREHDFKDALIASPGAYTTAESLMRIMFFSHNFKRFSFAKIPMAVASGECKYGVIIHESRLNLKKYGLVEIFDLSSLWLKKTGLFSPLGCYVIKKSIGDLERKKICSLIKDSFHWSCRHTNEVERLALDWSQEKSKSLVWKHIRKFVRRSSLEIDEFEKKSFVGFCEYIC